MQSKPLFDDFLFEHLFDLTYETAEMEGSLLKDLELIVQFDVENLYHILEKPWETYGENITNYFTAIQHLSNNNESKNKFKEAMAHIAPNRIVNVIDNTFDKRYFASIEETYRDTFYRLTSNGLGKIADRYRISPSIFSQLEKELMEDRQLMLEPIRHYCDAYKNMINVLKTSNNNGDDLFIFGAGILSSVLAGPLAGIATRTALRSIQSNDNAIVRASHQLLARLIDVDSTLRAIFARISRKLVYFFSHTYYGLYSRLKDDANVIQFEVIGMDPLNKQIKVRKPANYESSSNRYFTDCVMKIKSGLESNNFQLADSLSMQLVQFANEDRQFSEQRSGKHTRGYEANLIRYIVLIKQIEQIDDVSHDSIHFHYSKFFQGLYVGTSDVDSVAGILVPNINEHIVRYILSTEYLAKNNADKASAYRGSTLSHLHTYVKNFLSVDQYKRVYRSNEEVILGDTLTIIQSYEDFVKKLGIQVESDLLTRVTDGRKSYTHVLNTYFNRYINQFTMFLKRQPNTNSAVPDLKKNVVSYKEPEKKYSILNLYSFYELLEKTNLGEIEDTEEGQDEFFHYKKEYVDFRFSLMEAKNGNVDQQYNTGLHYYKGMGVNVDDEQAYYWLSLAAKAAHIHAIDVLIHMYGSRRISKNPQVEFQLYQKYIEEMKYDDPNLQRILGLFYLEGYGTQVDFTKAKYWLNISAEKGNKEAKFELAKMYEQAIGTEKNIKRAIRLYNEAAESGHQEAIIKVQEINRKKYKKILKYFVAPVAIIALIVLSINTYINKLEDKRVQAERAAEAEAELKDKQTRYKENVQEEYTIYITNYCEGIETENTNFPTKEYHFSLYPQIGETLYDFHAYEQQLKCVVNKIESNLTRTNTGENIINGLNKDNIIEAFENLSSKLKKTDYSKIDHTEVIDKHRETYGEAIDAFLALLNTGFSKEEWDHAVNKLKEAEAALKKSLEEKDLYNYYLSL